MNSSNSHIIAFTVLQILIAVLFLLFVRSLFTTQLSIKIHQPSLLLLDMTLRLPRRVRTVFMTETSRSRLFTPVINYMRNSRILIPKTLPQCFKMSTWWSSLVLVSWWLSWRSTACPPSPSTWSAPPSPSRSSPSSTASSTSTARTRRCYCL